MSTGQSGTANQGASGADDCSAISGNAVGPCRQVGHDAAGVTGGAGDGGQGLLPGGHSGSDAAGSGGAKGGNRAGASAGNSSAGGSVAAGNTAQAGVAASAPANDPTSTGHFVHPGLLITREDLTRARDHIAARSEPYFSAYTSLSADAASQADWAMEAPPAIIGRNSASEYASTRYRAEAAAAAAYQNALVFALTDETAHADKARDILDSYAQTTQHFDKVDPERDLEAAILGWLWVSTAELLRATNYRGWPESAVRAFGTWIHDVVYADTAYEARGVLVTPLTNGAGARGAFGLRTKLAIGVYLEDRTIYGEAVEYFFHGRGNGAPRYYIDTTTGQTWEAGRDQGHAQGGLSRLIETAHIAQNQGDVSLYAWEDFALARAIEYIAQYNLGEDVSYRSMQPYTTDWADVYDRISSDGRGKFATIYELPYAYFHATLAMPMPFTKRAIEREGTEQFSPNHDDPLFATLFYRR